MIHTVWGFKNCLKKVTDQESLTELGNVKHNGRVNNMCTIQSMSRTLCDNLI